MYYYHNDHLGTPQAMSDAAGEKVWEAEYEPFGKATVNEDPDGDGMPVINNLRFPGQYHDAETGLHYNYHRDYQPETGRYLQPDPIGLLGGLNPYRYVRNNPINFIDPLGLYDRVVHYALTLQLALKAGFSVDVANRIAAADQGIDDNSDTGPFDKDGGPEYHFSSHTTALSKLNGVCSPEDLGKALHRLQDSYSHAGYSWETGGHIRDGVKPDQYDPASERDRAMRSETLRKLITIMKLQGSMW
ncbi:MAG: RHS repeat domain-containing protein [Candidatus Methylomirabilia bacterium]